MSDPRDPEMKEEQLPDALDQTPGAHPAEGAGAEHGSEDAQLLAEASGGESDVEQVPPAEDDAPPGS